MVNSVIKKVDSTVFSIWGVLRLAHTMVVKTVKFLREIGECISFQFIFNFFMD